MLSDASLEAALEAAWERRAALHDDPDTDVYRIFDGLHEGLKGWTVDRYGPVAFCRNYKGPHGDTEADLIAWCRNRFEAVVVADGPLRDVHGTLPRPLIVREDELIFEIDLQRGHNTGLFADARLVRRWLRDQREGLRVLNLFSYTCSLGAAAAAGGARSVTNVDAVPSALDRGRANFEHNGLPADTRSFLRSEVFDFLRRAIRRGETWDLVIADPPPVPTRGRARGWDPRTDMPKLLERVAEVLPQDGRLLLLSAVRGRARFEDRLPPGDFPEVGRGLDFPGPSDGGLRGFVIPRSAILRTDGVHPSS